MRSIRLIPSVFVVGILALGAVDAPAQQTTISTPMHSVSDSFFETMGASWSMRFPNGFASIGDPSLASPQFGNFNPGAGMGSGVGFAGPNGSGGVGWWGRQGYSQSFVSQTPSVTTMNGYPGYFADTTVSPFVISNIPVVGGFPTTPYNPFAHVMPYSMGAPTPALTQQGPRNHRVQAFRGQLADRSTARQKDDLPAPPAVDRPEVRVAQPQAPVAKKPNRDDLDLIGDAVAAAPPAGKLVPSAVSQRSSAGRAVPSVAEARRLHEAEQATDDQEAMVWYEKALTAEDAGKPGLAKVYYQMVVRRADGELLSRAQARLKDLDSAGAR